MWPGPYGDLGSRKYILASAEQSLTRMSLDYVDIFYSHRVDPVTPIEETIGALDTLVRQGKALLRRASRRTAPSARRSPPRSPAASGRRSSSTSPRTRSSTAGSKTA